MKLEIHVISEANTGKSCAAALIADVLSMAGAEVELLDPDIVTSGELLRARARASKVLTGKDITVKVVQVNKDSI